MAVILQRPLIVTLLCFIAGILVGHFTVSLHPDSAFYIALLSAFLLIILLIVPSRVKLYGILLLFFMVGIFIDQSRHPVSLLSPLARERQRVTLAGTVLTPPRIQGDTARMSVRAENLLFDGREKSIQENVLVRVYGYSRDFSPGQRICFPARLGPFKNFENPGRYNYVL
ncbi:MAG: ComEC/Rec2 family competence protein, partial [Pseudomonadota bacterium]